MLTPVVIRGPTAPSHADTVRALALGLERHGWEVRDIDLDLVAGRAVVELHRFDGRWVRLSADSLGRVHLERWSRTIALGHGYKRGPLSPQVTDTFLGRTRPEGIRSGLRALCAYVADNPAPGFPAIEAADVRRLVAPLLAAT